MKLANLALVILLIGCKPDSDSKQSNLKATREVPMEVIQRIPSRLKLLKSGMTQQQALEILDLAPYQPRGFGDGSQSSWNCTYHLRTNLFLTMGLDRTQVPTKLTGVRGSVVEAPAVLDGDGWKVLNSR